MASKCSSPICVCAAFAVLASLTAHGVVATGGTVKVVDGYVIHTFTNSGSFAVTKGGNVDVLVVGGGGGGGAGGHSSNNFAPGGNGGSGVVIIRCPRIPNGLTILFY